MSFKKGTKVIVITKKYNDHITGAGSIGTVNYVSERCITVYFNREETISKLPMLGNHYTHYFYPNEIVSVKRYNCLLQRTLFKD